MDGTWTISELAERAAAALAAGEAAQVNGRVRDLPNERLIRWYTTIGLIDPPAGRRGRTALYGPRHLLQLAAVKRRQAAGRSIAEIQFELAAATDAALERIAALPPGAADPNTDFPTHDMAAPHSAATSEDGPAPAGPAPAASPAGTTTATAPGGTGPPAGLAAGHTEPSAGTAARNAEPPAGPAAGDPEPPTGTATGGTEAPVGGTDGEGTGANPRGRFWSGRPDVSFGRAAVADGYARPAPPVVQGVRLAPDLTLLLEVAALSADDLGAIESAARPLLEALAARGLIASPARSVRPPADPPRRPQ